MILKANYDVVSYYKLQIKRFPIECTFKPIWIQDINLVQRNILTNLSIAATDIFSALPASSLAAMEEVTVVSSHPVSKNCFPRLFNPKILGRDTFVIWETCGLKQPFSQTWRDSENWILYFPYSSILLTLS
jgi:hypothetical protein